jgi:hypothetical protein
VAWLTDELRRVWKLAPFFFSPTIPLFPLSIESFFGRYAAASLYMGRHLRRLSAILVAQEDDAHPVAAGKDPPYPTR